MGRSLVIVYIKHTRNLRSFNVGFCWSSVERNVALVHQSFLQGRSFMIGKRNNLRKLLINSFFSADFIFKSLLSNEISSSFWRCTVSWWRTDSIFNGLFSIASLQALYHNYATLTLRNHFRRFDAECVVNRDECIVKREINVRLSVT